jgi:hypothetical protein
MEEQKKSFDFLFYVLIIDLQIESKMKFVKLSPKMLTILYSNTTIYFKGKTKQRERFQNVKF